jgi:hypothetical protein
VATVSNPEPVSPTELQWADKAEEEQFSALSRVRAAAEKWATTIATLTGVFSLAAFVKGNDDISKLTQTTQYVVAAILALALLCAVLTIFLAALAAQGAPAYFSADENPRNDPDAYRTHYENEVAHAVALLYWSRRLVIPVIVLLAIAIGTMWFGPTQSTPSAINVLVTKETGAVLCGELVGGPGTLSIKAKQANRAMVLDHVATLQVTETCPGYSVSDEGFTLEQRLSGLTWLTWLAFLPAA